MDFNQYIEDFLSNIIPKNQLKRKFIENYNYIYGGEVENSGIPLDNIKDKICYFLTAFNLISRLQYTIFREIDNLCEIDFLYYVQDKVLQDKCLEVEEAQQFNKYLLIQTIIEAQEERFRTNYVERSVFIKNRLYAYVLDKSMFSGKILEQKKLIQKITSEDLEFFGDYILEEDYEKNYEQNFLEKIDRLYRDISITFDNLFRYEGKDFEEETASYIKKTSKLYRPRVSELLNYINEKGSKFLEYEFIGKIQPVLLKLEHDLELFERYSDIDIECTNKQNEEMNITKKVNSLCLIIGSYAPSGNSPEPAVRIFLSNIDPNMESTVYTLEPLRQLEILHRGTGPDYIFNTSLLTENAKQLIKELYESDYNLCGVAWNCNNRHSISSICFGKDCKDLVHIYLNEDKQRIKVPIGEYSGYMCHPKEKVSGTLLLFERRTSVCKLKKLMKEYSEENGMEMPIVRGGNFNYYKKYLKYKKKYLELKNK